MTMLSRGDARTLMLGGMVLVAILGGSRGLPLAYRITAERREHAALREREVERLESHHREAQRARRMLRELGAHHAFRDSSLMADGAPSMASARLGALLAEAASGAEARLGALQLSTDTTPSGAGLMRARARATVSGDLTSIALLIQSLEAGVPMLAVRELTIVQPQPAVQTGQTESLQAELVVEGLFRGERRGR